MGRVFFAVFLVMQLWEMNRCLKKLHLIESEMGGVREEGEGATAANTTPSLPTQYFDNNSFLMMMFIEYPNICIARKKRTK